MKRKQIVFDEGIHRRLKREAKQKMQLLEGRAKEIMIKGWRYEELESLGLLKSMTECRNDSPAPEVKP